MSLKWKYKDYPFLIADNNQIKFSDVETQNLSFLSILNKGNVVALVGDFNPFTISVFLKLIEKKNIIIPLTKETKTYHAMHHPFTSPKTDQIDMIDSDPSAVRADAYDLVLNGNEIGGGSIRIHDKKIQQKIFDCLGFTKEEADKQFGFLMNAFEYGAPPHGGIAFGLDRLVAIMGGNEIIRDFIAFPKNNSGRDIMIDSPSSISEEQLREINLKKRS